MSSSSRREPRFPSTEILDVRAGVLATYDEPSGTFTLTWLDGQALTGTAEDLVRRARDILRAVEVQRLAQYTADVGPFFNDLRDI